MNIIDITDLSEAALATLLFVALSLVMPGQCPAMVAMADDAEPIWQVRAVSRKQIKVRLVASANSRNLKTFTFRWDGKGFARAGKYLYA